MHRAWWPAIVWMVLIFWGSTDLLSGSRTSSWFLPILRWLFPNSSPEVLELVQLLLRKCGHLLEFAVLAILVRRAFHWQESIPVRNWNSKMAMLSVLIAFLYAAFDEIHQSFVPTRVAAASDVLIDTFGAGSGLLLVYLSIRTLKTDN